MAWSNPNTPNITDFMLFLQNSMGIPSNAIPAQDTWPQWALNRAIALVLRLPVISGAEYTIVVYNCAGHIFLKITPDNPNILYLAQAREKFNLLSFVTGVVQGSSDNSTSQSLTVPQGLSNLTVGDLNFMLTPWGREYLAYAQDFGAIAGLT